MTKDAVLGSPVDPTTTAAWDTLEETAQEFVPDISGWFASDPKRAEALTLTAGDLHVDLSKNLVTQSVLDQLLALAEQTGVEQHRDRMFEGAAINSALPTTIGVLWRWTPPLWTPGSCWGT